MPPKFASGKPERPAERMQARAPSMDEMCGHIQRQSVVPAATMSKDEIIVADEAVQFGHAKCIEIPNLSYTDSFVYVRFMPPGRYYYIGMDQKTASWFARRMLPLAPDNIEGFVLLKRFLSEKCRFSHEEIAYLAMLLRDSFVRSRGVMPRNGDAPAARVLPPVYKPVKAPRPAKPTGLPKHSVADVVDAMRPVQARREEHGKHAIHQAVDWTAKFRDVVVMASELESEQRAKIEQDQRITKIIVRYSEMSSRVLGYNSNETLYLRAGTYYCFGSEERVAEWFASRVSPRPITIDQAMRLHTFLMQQSNLPSRVAKSIVMLCCAGFSVTDKMLLAHKLQEKEDSGRP